MFPITGYSSLVPMAGTIGPRRWRVHQALDDHRSILAIQPQSLAEILPGIYEDHERLHSDTDVLIDRYVAQCPEIYPRCRFNPLREEEIREVYYVTLRELSRSSIGTAGFDVSSIWQRRLERLIEVDRADVRLAGRVFIHRRSNHLFRALAELSYINRSLRIGNVLHSFFVRHASQIVAVESSATIGQWCNAILRATMTERQRLDCFRRVYELRPDLPQSLRRYGPRGELVAETMERIALGAGAQPHRTVLERPSIEYYPASARAFPNQLPRSLQHRPAHRTSFLAMSGALPDALVEDNVDDLTRDSHSLVPRDRLLQDDLANQRLLELFLGPRYASRSDDVQSIDDLSLLSLDHDADDIFGGLVSDAGLDISDGLDF